MIVASPRDVAEFGVQLNFPNAFPPYSLFICIYDRVSQNVTSNDVYCPLYDIYIL